MNTVKIIVKSLLKRKLVNTFIVIQLVITLFITSDILRTISYFSYPQKQIEDTLNLDTNNIVHLNFLYSSPSENYVNSVYELEKYINTLDGVTGVGCFDYSNTVYKELSKNKDFNNIRKELTKGTFKEKYLDTVEIIKVDKAIYNLMTIKITSGTNFKDKDFETSEDIIPLLVGSKYISVVKLNEVLTDLENNKKYQVIGFIDANSKWLNGDDYISFSLSNIDDKFIVPYYSNEKAVESWGLARLHNIFYKLEKSNDKSFIDNKILQKALTLNLAIKTNTVSEELTTYFTNRKEAIFSGALLGISLIFFSYCGLIAVTLSSILDRRKEIGIRIMAGANKFQIKLLFLGELLFLNVLSFIISSTFIINDNTKRNNIAIEYGLPHYPFPIEILLTTLISLILITLLTALVPMKKIDTLQPNELIGGFDQ